MAAGGQAGVPTEGAHFAIGTWVAAAVVRLSAAQISSLGVGSGMSLPIEAMKSIGSNSQREMILYPTALAVCPARWC